MHVCGACVWRMCVVHSVRHLQCLYACLFKYARQVSSSKSLEEIWETYVYTHCYHTYTYVEQNRASSKATKLFLRK